jgi:hypothetical protein
MQLIRDNLTLWTNETEENEAWNYWWIYTYINYLIIYWIFK